MKDWDILKVDECPSTNALMKQKKQEGEVNDKTAILTDFQTSGRGQGENVWYSDHGKNLLGSFYKKVNVTIDMHFHLTIVASLAICETLKKLGIEALIKWPNDIYVYNSKIAGILIENSLLNDKISDSIIGVGLNINQKYFPDSLPNPVSISQLIQREAEREVVLKIVFERIDKLFDTFLNGNTKDLFHAYNKKLYRLNKWHVYIHENLKFNGQIRGVLPDGHLIIETDSGVLKHFLHGEVKYTF